MKKRVSSWLVLPLLFSFFSGKAQKPVLNHLAFYVSDLARSTHFYQHIIGLDTIPEPFRDGKHTWFAMGGKAQLHLIAGASGPQNRDKNTHLCFSVPSVDKFIAVLKGAGIPFEDWPGTPGAVTLRVDGVKQIYFRDPDGYWIEVNDARS